MWVDKRRPRELCIWSSFTNPHGNPWLSSSSITTSDSPSQGLHSAWFRTAELKKALKQKLGGLGMCLKTQQLSSGGRSYAQWPCARKSDLCSLCSSSWQSLQVSLSQVSQKSLSASCLWIGQKTVLWPDVLTDSATPKHTNQSGPSQKTCGGFSIKLLLINHGEITFTHNNVYTI